MNPSDPATWGLWGVYSWEDLWCCLACTGVSIAAFWWALWMVSDLLCEFWEGVQRVFASYEESCRWWWLASWKKRGEAVLFVVLIPVMLVGVVLFLPVSFIGWVIATPGAIWARTTWWKAPEGLVGSVLGWFLLEHPIFGSRKERGEWEAEQEKYWQRQVGWVEVLSKQQIERWKGLSAVEQLAEVADEEEGR